MEGRGEGGFEMTRRVTLKLTGEIPARGEASLACSLGPGAITRQTAYMVTSAGYTCLATRSSESVRVLTPQLS